jgi:lipopolysaccharide assembly protein A
MLAGGERDRGYYGAGAMKIITKLVAVLLFIIFFGFALKNTQEVGLRFFFGYERHDPLVLLLLGFFVAGATLGVLAMTPTVFRYRREVARHKKNALAMQQNVDAAQQARTPVPPQPDSLVNK